MGAPLRMLEPEDIVLGLLQGAMHDAWIAHGSDPSGGMKRIAEWLENARENAHSAMIERLASSASAIDWESGWQIARPTQDLNFPHPAFMDWEDAGEFGPKERNALASVAHLACRLSCLAILSDQNEGCAVAPPASETRAMAVAALKACGEMSLDMAERLEAPQRRKNLRIGERKSVSPSPG